MIPSSGFSEEVKTKLQEYYGRDHLDSAKKRYISLSQEYTRTFGDVDCHLFSVPGRTEIGGNHTDHNLGRVLAGSVTLDALSAAGPGNDNRVVCVSRGFDRPFEVDLTSLEVRPEEKGTTEALIRGVAAGFRKNGCRYGGFTAVIHSDVLPGSGLSSSAVIEVTIGSILNGLFNDNRVPSLEIAKIGQFAENTYMGKPSGLMDQIACSLGGIVAIDFHDPGNPEVEQVDFAIQDYGYVILVVDTKGHHANLIPEYASIPEEMRRAAGAFGRRNLREVDYLQFMENIPEIRKNCGDRAVLRSLHFFQENRRVEEQVESLKKGDFTAFLGLVRDSGSSSWRLLQNISVAEDPENQEVGIALALTEEYIAEIGEGACRVHGGGFAGTILVFLPEAGSGEYCRRMERIFGEGCVTTVGIRRQGAEMIL